jgi:Zn-dependent M16 (insulinase) family peptidase
MRGHDKAKKWREKDKKTLFEKIKEKYLLFRRMRITLIKVDPSKKPKKSTNRKRSKKRNIKRPPPA